MVKVSWVDKNIFTAYDMPAYITVDAGYTHRLKVYESETIIYVDDTVTGTNRPATPYEVRVWETNPHGTPPQTPSIYNVYVDIFDTNNVLKERITLKYMYGAGKYSLNIVDENNNPFEAQIYYCIRTSSDAFVVNYYGSNISVVDRGVNDLIIEIVRNKENKKYYMVALNPTLYTNTVIRLSPRDKFIIKVTYDVSMFNNIPILKDIYNFLMWLGTNVTNALLPISQAVTNIVGIKLPIVKIEYSNGLLSVYYENDVAPAIIVAIVIAIASVGIAVAWAIRDIKTAEITYSIEQLAHESYRQYLYTVNKAIEYAQTTPNPDKTLEIILGKIQMPQYGSLSETLNNKDSMIEQLKNMLMLAIGGAIVIAVLMMVRK